MTYPPNHPDHPGEPKGMKVVLQDRGLLSRSARRVSTEDTDWRASQLRGFQQVIGAILVLDEPLTIRQIIALLADIPEDDFIGCVLRSWRIMF
jgi:hypothetical protein